MLKILHIGDVHLDCPFSMLDIKKSARRKAELRETFTAALEYGAREGVRLALISGDLFESGYASKETASFLCSRFAAMPGCRFVISPGNHDPYAPGSIYTWAAFPENVYIFDSEELSRFEFTDIGAEVYGYAFNSSRLESSPLSAALVSGLPSSSGIRLLCAHADIGDPLSRYAPLSLSDLQAGGFAYAALGHIHNPPPRVDCGVPYAYSGFLMGRGFDECGEGGAYIAQIDGGRPTDLRRIGFTGHKYEDVILDLDNTGQSGGAAPSSDSEVLGLIETLIAERGYGEETALRVTLTGAAPIDYTPDTARLERELNASGRLDFIKLRDATVLSPDAGYLTRDVSVRGQFYRILQQKLESGDPRERETAALALRYGLAAFDGRDFFSDRA